LEKPDKYWKFTLSDIQERAYWKDYRKAYEHCLSATSTESAPWYVVPADDKKDARLIISRITPGKLQDLKMEYPRPSKERLKELETARKTVAGSAKKERGRRMTNLG